MRRVWNTFVWYVWIFIHVAQANFTFTHEMAMRCKEHVALHGYSYETFYEVYDLNHQSKEEAFEMHLAILAANNGHILLSTTPHPDPDDPVYELVVGGGGNKFTEIRRNLRRNGKHSQRTIGILSAIEYRAFYIKISHDGLIEFGQEGEPLPIITYSDVNPITVKFFSFAAWHGVEAKFLYDCPPPGEKTAKALDSKKVEPKLSNSENLKRTLLTSSIANLPPGPAVRVKLDFSIMSIKYDAYEAKLTTLLAMVIVWTDNRLAWFPDKFNGTKFLKFRQGEIWKPSFFVFNADDMGLLSSKNPELISMTSNGEATLHFQTKIETWCHDDDMLASKKRWPNDQFDCTILIGAWQPHEKFTLQGLDTSTEDKLKMYADIDDIVQNEWEVDLKKAIVPISTWKEFFQPMDNETNQSDRLIINLELKRRSTALNIVFYTPLIVLTVFVLLSFWDEPLQMSRVWFYASFTVAICSGICYINYLVPCHSVPTIMILYSTVLMGVLIALLVQVLLMTSVAERLCKTVSVQSLLTARWFRAVFCLPVMKTCRNYDSINEGFSSQDGDDYGVMVTPRNGTMEEMQPEAVKYGEREELAQALDKLMFFIYSVTFAIMLALHY